MSNDSNAVLAVSDEQVARQTYASVEPEMKALPPEEVKQINLDIPAMLATVFGVLPKVQPYREAIAGLAGGISVEQFDKLEPYAVAMSQANSYHTMATQTPDDLESAHAEGVTLRNTLYTDATVQVRRGIFSETILTNLKGINGYKNLASDLQDLSSVYFKNWSKLAGNTSVKQEEIDRASQLATHIFRVVGMREQAPARAAETADLRARAFTLLTDTYDAIRRGIIYLRWNEGDADEIAPSLFAGRSNGRKKPTATPNATTAKPDAHPPAVLPLTNSGNASSSDGNATHTNAADLATNGPFMR